jgi:hypothetical protein
MSTPQHTLSPAPPWHITTGVTWYSASEFAKRWSRSAKQIRIWCKNGTLIDAHCRVYRDLKGRWWIGVPDPSAHLSNPIA